MASVGSPPRRRSRVRRAIAVIATCALAAGVLAACAASEPPARRLAHAGPPPVDPVLQYARDRLRTMSLDEKIRSMIMAHGPGADGAALDEFATAGGFGGLILLRDNVPDPEEALAAVTAAARGQAGLPRLIGIDEEGGVVTRLDSDTGPGAEVLRDEPADGAAAAFSDRAALLAARGVSVNFGIVADVTGDPDSFIADRVLGTTAADAAPRVAAAVAGERGIVLSTLKHFPGHGVAPGDSHSSIPTTAIDLDAWRADHAEPFRAGIAAGAEFVMMGHLQFDAVDPQPASLSPLWHDVLRSELGFDGIIITDDLTMLEHSGRDDLADQAANAVRAVAAGNTMLLYVGAVDVDAVVAAVREAVLAGSIDEAVVDDAALKLLVLRRTLSGETGRFVHCLEACEAMVR